MQHARTVTKEDEAGKPVAMVGVRDVADGRTFRTADGALYFNKGGQLRRVNKDKRAKKQRRREQRAKRAALGHPVELGSLTDKE